MPCVVIGLGNKGPKYSRTRHNVGFRIIDLLSSELKIKIKKPLFKEYMIGQGCHDGVSFFIVKPLTYMNRSGEILPALLERTETTVQDIIVVCDTLDLPPGLCRIKKRGSSAGQKGLESIIRHAETDQFLRIFIGIGRPREKGRVIEHVLGIPPLEEELLINRALLKVKNGILDLMHKSVEIVMNELNATKIVP